MSEVLREEDSDEGEDTVADPTPVETSDAPAGDSEVKAEEVIAPEEEVATPTDPQDFSDVLMKEWMGDPIKKTVLERMIDKESKRRIDERLGAELGFMEKEVRKGYKENPEKWKEDRRKIDDYDRLKTESEKIRSEASSPPQVPSTKADAPVDDAASVAKAFVEAQGIQDEQVPVITELIKLIEQRMDSRVQKRVEDTVPQAIDARQWKAEIDWASSQNDYKDNRKVRALAHDYSRVDGMSPKQALLQARKDLGIVPPKTTISQGKPAVGKPAFARESSSDVGEDADEYDGTDPLAKLKKKFAARG